MDDIEPVVIDLGSGKVRAGLGGADAPVSEFDNIVGTLRNPGVLIGVGSKINYVGDEAQSQRGILSLTYPIEHGIVQNWDALEKVLHHTIFNGLRVAPEEHPIMLSEHPMNPKRDRERLCQMMFESFAVPAYFSGLSPIMAGYSYGITTSCVVNIGDGVISVTPICWGYISRKTIRRINFGGRDLTNYMHRMLADRGYYLNRSSDFQTVRDLKEKLCYVALDYEAELQTSQNCTKLEKEYEMPDGQIITLNSERFRCHEALFKPSMVGLETPGITTQLCHVTGTIGGLNGTISSWLAE